LSKVNFFVIGAAKCGTTTLYARLRAHPEVFLSPMKEPNFYSRKDIDPSRFSRAFKANTRLDHRTYLKLDDPLPDRQVGFVETQEEYARLFRGTNEDHRIVGECSTSYLWSKAAPQALFAAHPKAKIVVSLRDPIDRIYSHYLMARKYGFVSGSVVEAVKKDMAHPDPSWGRSELFLELSMYEAQLNRWRACFPPEQLLVLEPGALRLESTWEELQLWLGLSPQNLFSGASSEDTNKAGLPRFEKLNRGLTSIGIKKAFGRIVPKKLKSRALDWYYHGKKVPLLTKDERSELTKILKRANLSEGRIDCKNLPHSGL
jgi:hypothetical protein